MESSTSINDLEEVQPMVCVRASVCVLCVCRVKSKLCPVFMERVRRRSVGNVCRCQEMAKSRGSCCHNWADTVVF